MIQNGRWSKSGEGVGFDELDGAGLEVDEKVQAGVAFDLEGFGGKTAIFLDFFSRLGGEEMGRRWSDVDAGASLKLFFYGKDFLFCDCDAGEKSFISAFVF